MLLAGSYYPNNRIRILTGNALLPVGHFFYSRIQFPAPENRILYAKPSSLTDPPRMPVFLKARWQNLVMANYAVSPELLQPYVPPGVTLDFFRDKCYISLVGFLFKGTRLFRIPVPFLGSFEEINLRFYVKRGVDNDARRGVVFINETVPYRAVAWVANKLYNEHYTAVSTKHSRETTGTIQKIRYGWKTKAGWNQIAVTAGTSPVVMESGSFEEYIFEHYYGYTKISNTVTEEYAVKHPRWLVHEVTDYSIQCDFGALYGPAFGWLKNVNPEAVFLAEGSAVEVDWKRERLAFPHLS